MNGPISKGVSSAYARAFSGRSAILKIVEEMALGTRLVDAHPDGHQHGDRKPTETSVTEFGYKRVNLSLEELKNNTEDQ